MQRAFVTGGSGFVGRNLIIELAKRGVHVCALARSDAAEQAVRAAGAKTVARGDLDDTKIMTEGMRGCDVVFHAAAKVDIWGDPAEFHRITVQGTQNTLDAAKAAGVKKFVHVSTEAVLAGIRKPMRNMTEDWAYPEKPAGLYPLTKGLAERAVIAANSPQLTTVAVRPPMIWGKGDTSLLPKIAEAVQRGQWVWFDGGNYTHTTTHVANVVHGLLLAAEKGRGGEIYFVSDGPEQNFREFMTALLATRGVPARGRTLPFGLARVVAYGGEWLWKTFKLKGMPPLPITVLWIMGQSMSVDISKAKRELGYEPVMTFERGLAELSAEG